MTLHLDMAPPPYIFNHSLSTTTGEIGSGGRLRALCEWTGSASPLVSGIDNFRLKQKQFAQSIRSRTPRQWIRQ